MDINGNEIKTKEKKIKLALQMPKNAFLNNGKFWPTHISDNSSDPHFSGGSTLHGPVWNTKIENVEFSINTYLGNKKQKDLSNWKDGMLHSGDFTFNKMESSDKFVAQFSGMSIGLNNKHKTIIMITIIGNKQSVLDFLSKRGFITKDGYLIIPSWAEENDDDEEDEE